MAETSDSVPTTGDYILSGLGDVAGAIGALTGVPQAEAAAMVASSEASREAIKAEEQSTMLFYGAVVLGVFGAALIGSMYLFKK